MRGNQTMQGPVRHQPQRLSFGSLLLDTLNGGSMLKGTSITLRPVRQTDLDEIYARHIDIANRGDFFPRGIRSQTTFIKQFNDTGFWSNEDGLLVITTNTDQIVGHIEFYKTVNYLDEYELSYILYTQEHRGQGAMTEAVNLMVRYLFETKNINRIRLVIHPDNLASRRLAEKCHFQHEGTARGAWYNKGMHHNVEIYSILHDEVVGAHTPGE
jgi:ribosomal-protein-alanine N-acetyltransferase